MDSKKATVNKREKKGGVKKKETRKKSINQRILRIGNKAKIHII
jgi:hypothetical protein